jgi:pimeloyl-ACP methyl ester carboxylesterase
VGVALAARGHGSIAVDLRGHGESSRPDDGYDFRTITDDLIPFLGNRPIVAGQSYGGLVAVELAARHPDAVGAIACVDGGAADLRGRFSSLDEALAVMRPPYQQFEGIASPRKRRICARPIRIGPRSVSGRRSLYTTSTRIGVFAPGSPGTGISRSSGPCGRRRRRRAGRTSGCPCCS